MVLCIKKGGQESYFNINARLRIYFAILVLNQMHKTPVIYIVCDEL